MFRRLICLVTACLYLTSLSCSYTKTKMVTPDAIKHKEDHIIAVALTSGTVVEFNDHGGRLDRDAAEIRGKTSKGEEVTIPLADVTSATVRRTNNAAVVVTVVTVAFIGIIILAASTSDTGSSTSSTSSTSCPYVYSFDGSRHVLDAEPLAGAISKGLERNDLCRLEHLAVHDGNWELLVRNELEETQYLDQMSLRVVDHPKGSFAYPSPDGSIRVISNPVSAIEAKDEAGVDLRALVEKPDVIPWQPVMPTDESWREVALRNELTFSFPKPADASHGDIVVGAATSFWGSVMMREMLQARGDGLAAWRQSVDGNGPAMGEMMRFNMREELYFLKVYVREGDRWVQRGWIPGGGPMVTETRVIPIDLSGVTGDTVTIRLLPPRGYWSIDYLAMSYGELPVTHTTMVPLNRATLGGGEDVTAALSATDGTYHVMKQVGDSMVMIFTAPTSPPDGERTVFLDTRGYYLSHIDESQPEQTALIAEMLANDGAITRYSLQKFVEFAGQVAGR